MKRRFLIPEVIQTSAMDCGPACLKALFGGFDVYLSYGRLREACQTDVDGTSIDTIEGLAAQLGMGIEQSMLPADLILLPDAARLPAIVVVTLPDGGTHFVVLWRVHGSWVQVMDPAVGRIWLPRQRFLELLYRHEHVVSAADWKDWAGTDEFRRGLDARMCDLGVPAETWDDPTHQDAALRLAGALRAAGQLRGAEEARELLSLCSRQPERIPDEFWTVRADPQDSQRLTLRGAVLLVADGCVSPPAPAASPALSRVLEEREPNLWTPLWAALRAGGIAVPALTAVVLCAAAAGSVMEALLFRGLFDLARHLESTAARVSALGAVLAFLVILLALDWPAHLGLLRTGRILELRLRLRFLEKVPLLGDRYFQSRLMSDMALRAHGLKLLRELPAGLGACLQLLASTLVTGVAIACIYPGTTLLVACAIAVACGVPLLLLPAAAERDLRYRELGASLASLQLETLMGARAVQAHGAQATLRALQADLLRRWRDAGLRRQALFVRGDLVQLSLGFAVVVAIVYRQATLVSNPAGLVLLIWWASSIPFLGQDLATAVRALPALRNTLLRFLEPIGAPQEEAGAVVAAAVTQGAAVALRDVSVVLAGRTVLEQVTFEAHAGEHVAIVGASGAGKSSLVGCLLGWYPPATGSILVDGSPLVPERLAQLRSETAWIDPQVQLFQRSLFDNLRYGNEGDAGAHVGAAVETAGLTRVLATLPDGLQTNLGEGGMRLSGGEGQRVRIARGFGRRGVRLAVLDEPARGLGRGQRRRMIAQARREYAAATLLCVTHDVTDTLDFDRVLVIEGGRIREQGRPADLCAAAGSRYRQLLEEERAVARELWQHPRWRRLSLARGRLTESRLRT